MLLYLIVNVCSLTTKRPRESVVSVAFYLRLRCTRFLCPPLHRLGIQDLLPDMELWEDQSRELPARWPPAPCSVGHRTGVGCSSHHGRPEGEIGRPKKCPPLKEGVPEVTSVLALRRDISWLNSPLPRNHSPSPDHCPPTGTPPPYHIISY